MFVAKQGGLVARITTDLISLIMLSKARYALPPEPKLAPSSILSLSRVVNFHAISAGGKLSQFHFGIISFRVIWGAIDCLLVFEHRSTELTMT